MTLVLAFVAGINLDILIRVVFYFHVALQICSTPETLVAKCAAIIPPILMNNKIVALQSVSSEESLQTKLTFECFSAGLLNMRPL